MTEQKAQGEEATEEDPLLEVEHPQGLEGKVFGKWTVRLRNICGVVACLSVCYNAINYTDTIKKAVLAGYGYPDRTSLGIVFIGPIVIALVFMNASKILQVIMKIPSVAEKLRKGTIGILTRPGDNPPPPPPPQN
ncbi:hypothetical protein [Klebsiella phage YC1]|nr:hypothetical protein [Klebsiella phage YC1]